MKAGDLSHQESNNMAASTMKLHSDSFTSEKVSEYRIFSSRLCHGERENVENHKTLRGRSSISTWRLSCIASRKNARRSFPGLYSCFWRSTKERALKRPRTDSLNRKLSSITTSKNRERRLRRVLAREVASLFTLFLRSAMQRAVI